MRIDAQVTEGSHTVTGLTKSDFVVLDEGQPQTVAYFGHEREPLSVLLLLDVSGSMRQFLDKMAATASQALQYLLPDDRVGVMLFTRRADLRQELTKERRFVVRAIQEASRDTGLGGGTAINAALLEAAQVMHRERIVPGRRAILILTDNQGMNYQASDDNVIRELHVSDAVLNGIVVGKFGRPTPPKRGRAVNPDFTPADIYPIAEATGGEVLKSDRVETAFPEMIERIRTRYSLQYRAPEAPAGTFRRVRVDLSPEARRKHPKAVVRARQGYFTGGAGEQAGAAQK